MSAMPFYLAGGAAKRLPIGSLRHVPIQGTEAWERWGWVVEGVSRRHGIPVNVLLGRGRDSIIAAARRDLYACLYGSGLAYAAIGRLLAVDHSSVMHGVAKELGR